MIIGSRTVRLKESFTSQLATIQEYISQYNPKKGRELTTSLANYVLDIVAPDPCAYLPSTEDVPHPKKCTPEPYSNGRILLFIK